jgi:hypothetical protein
MAHRRKISTTVAVETYAYLKRLVEAGEARNLAQALDVTLARLRRADNRARLELATAAYFQKLTAKGAREESRLEAALDQSADEIDFDRN